MAEDKSETSWGELPRSRLLGHHRPLCFIGVPMDLGADRRGVDMGPSAVRGACFAEKARKLGYEVIDCGDVPVSTPESREVGSVKAKYLPEITQAYDDLRGRIVEAYGPESIFQAITELNADRIGHGTRLFNVAQVEGADDPERYVRQLSEYISDRRITLEVCITSNLQTMPELQRVEDHPFGRMIRERLSVTLCTDNRLMSRTTMTDELAQACRAFELTREELRNVMIHGFKRSFFPGSYRDKRAYVRQVIDYYDGILAAEALESKASAV